MLRRFRRPASFGAFAVLRETDGALVTPRRFVPAHIAALGPAWARGGPVPAAPTRAPILSAAEDIAAMAKAGQLAARVLDTLEKHVVPGITTDALDALAHDLTLAANAYPSPLGYHGFPKSICTSVNNIICHGIPDLRPLEDGDIVKLDVTVFLGGFHGDSCRTVLVGDQVDGPGRALVEAGRACLQAGIAVCGPGVPVSEIGAAVARAAATLNVTPNRAFCGHGIGRHFHGPPDIFHFEHASEASPRMAPGMCFTIEPCILQGRDGMRIWARDGWTAATVDDGRCSQWEHTLIITDDGCRILTVDAEPGP